MTRINNNIPIDNSSKFAKANYDYADFQLEENLTNDTQNRIIPDEAAAQERMGAEGAVAAASYAAKKSSILDLSIEELIAKDSEIEKALSQMDLKSMSNSEKYKAITDLFTATFGDDFITVKRLHTSGSSVSDDEAMQRMIRGHFAFRSYNQALQSHILYDGGEVPKLADITKDIRRIGEHIREDFYPGKTVEEVQDIISAKYPPVGEMTNRDFQLMMSEMHEMGVDAGTSGTSYLTALAYDIQAAGGPPYSDMRMNDVRDMLMDKPFNPAYYASMFTDMNALERGRLGKEGLAFATKYLGCTLVNGYFPIPTREEYDEMLDAYIDRISA